MQLNRAIFKDALKCKADTILWEMTQDIVMAKERGEDCEWKNSFIYQEFWRRNKPNIYFDAYNRAMKRLGKNNHAIHNNFGKS